MANRDIHISPVGQLVFPNLNTARQFNGVGPFAYDTLLDVEGDEGVSFEGLIREYAADYAKRLGKRGGINLDKVILDATDKGGVPRSNTIRFKFKATIQQTKRGTWDRKPAFYQANGQPYTEEPMIWGGTVAQIAFSFYEWNFGGNNPGLTLQPEGLLIHELKTSKGTGDRSFEGLFGEVGRQAQADAKGVAAQQMGEHLQQRSGGANF